MARSRNYAAEEARRNELAQQRGFSNRSEERAFRREHQEEMRQAATALNLSPTRHGNPQGLVSYYENVYVPMMTGTDASNATGTDRHNAVTAFVDMGYSQEEAIELMRELYGDSGKEP